MSVVLNQKVYTVSLLNQTVSELLEDSFPLIWVEGEVSNLARPSSGHLYFSLKDAKAQVRCALFRNRVRLLRAELDNGWQVLVRARISLYEPRGDFQLIVEHLEEAGAGALRQAYEELRRRLEQEGLFELQRKRPLPAFPRRIGVITSPSGAAIRDVLSILKRRFPGLPVRVYPVSVQGEGAGEQIARALDVAARHGDCDLLLLVRGGGSLEDLWAFNEEVVARAIFACPIPVVVGVGHETDVTIADFVADLRAPTPSAAAEQASPDRAEWLAKVVQLQDRLYVATQRRQDRLRQALDSLEQRLLRQHPGRRLRERAQRLDELEQRLRRALSIRLERLQARLGAIKVRLRAVAPSPRIRRLQDQQQALLQRLEAAMVHRLERDGQRLAVASRALHAVSPLQTLGRGYAIVRRSDGTVVRRARQVEVGDRVENLLAEGKLICRVEELN